MENKHTIEERWQDKFLNAGKEKGLGDLSMMIGVVSEILTKKEEEIKTTKSTKPNGGWIAHISCSYYQAWAETEEKAKEILIKELHLRV